ncbi:MAG: hypothetical protein ACOYLH_05690 [Flavobacteriales bacterium]
MNKLLLRISVLLWLTASCVYSSTAQSDSTRTWKDDLGLFPKADPGGLKKLNVSGFYRFLGTYNRMYDSYLISQTSGETVLPRSLFIGDDSQLPNMTVNVSGGVGKATWGFDLYIYQFLTGNIGTAYSAQTADSLRPSIQFPMSGTRLGQTMGLQLGMTMYGTIPTKYADISASFGGIQWVALSDLTIASFKGYNRFMLFERAPWDPAGLNIGSRYKQYFDQGSIDQDTRWGNRAFVGAVFDVKALPGRISATAMIGKTELNGGFSQVPNFTYGGKIKKDISTAGFVAINTLNSFAYTDSLARDAYGFHIITGEFNFLIKGFRVRGEAGLGNYFSPQHDNGWNELMQFKIATPAKANKPVVEAHYFRIDPYVINNNAIFWNTATPEYRVNDIPAGSVGSSSLLQPFGSSIIRVSQMTNNRQGADVNVDAKVGKLKISAGAGFTSELMPAAQVITYGHPVNQFTRSRFWRWTFPANVGPYNRYSDIFRDTYETVNLSDDSSGVVINKKHFSGMEAQLKYSTMLAGRELFIFSLFQMNSAQRDWSPVLVTTEKAYVRQYASEVEMYYRIASQVMLSGYYGYERTIANYLTDIDEETRRPRNQYGEGVGVGLDIDLGKNARLYLRHRWYYFRDESFELDRFRGREMTVELKAFF